MPERPDIFRCYHYNGDILRWEFFKYALWASHSASYYQQRTFLTLGYPPDFVGADRLIEYFYNVFAFCFQTDVVLTDELSPICTYVQRQALGMENLIYLGDDVAILHHLDLEPESVYFWRPKTSSELTRLSRVYANMGLFNETYDDRIIYVPKKIASYVWNDLMRIQKDYHFTTTGIQQLTQFVIQTHSIINNIPVATLDSVPYIVERDVDKAFLVSKSAPENYLEI